MRLEAEGVWVAYRTAEQRHYMEESLAQFWGAADHMFSLADEGRDAEARDQNQGCRYRRTRRRSASRWPVSWWPTTKPSSRRESASRRFISGCSGGVMLFLSGDACAHRADQLVSHSIEPAAIPAIVGLVEQRSELAQKLITTQESTLLHISRELHDEFGQILTAIGSMLRGAGQTAPEGSTLRADL